MRKAGAPIGDAEPITGDTFKLEVDSWADRIGVAAKDVHLRPMVRKWASASTTGRVTFDTAILKQPQAFRDEVIVHELLHLKVPNHGAVFKALLKAHLAERESADVERVLAR
jgi:predicted metal-dependent hydrolase